MSGATRTDNEIAKSVLAFDASPGRPPSDRLTTARAAKTNVTNNEISKSIPKPAARSELNGGSLPYHDL